MHEALKYSIIEKIVQTNDEGVLRQVKHFLDERETQLWDDLDPALKPPLKEALSKRIIVR